MILLSIVLNLSFVFELLPFFLQRLQHLDSTIAGSQPQQQHLRLALHVVKAEAAAALARLTPKAPPAADGERGALFEAALQDAAAAAATSNNCSCSRQHIQEVRRQHRQRQRSP